MARIPTTENLILESVRDRLIDQVDGFNQATVLVTDIPWPGDQWANSRILTVSPRDGIFDPANFYGGGYHVVTETAGFLVSYYSQEMAEAPNKIDLAMYKRPDGGWCEVKRQILRALLVDWEPSYNGNNLLRDMLSPAGSVSPRAFAVESVGRVVEAGVQFNIVWDWDLT